MLVAVVAAVVSTALMLPAGSAQTAPERRTPTLGARAQAEQTLALAQRLLGAKSPAAARAQLGASRDLTMVLRDLWLQRGALSREDRATARLIGGRPTGKNSVECSLTCVHWNPSETSDDFAAKVISTMDRVQGIYRKAGYRTPKADGGRGGNDLPDIYLDDIGSEGLYGYCTSDQTNQVADDRYDVWAYCVLDNDYSSNEFPTNTPLENMHVTAAHEYFHAVQYAYDSAEDGWFLESLSAWVEDELYPKVDDNIQYLQTSPISDPARSLDDSEGIGIYGSWVWIRYLGEQFPKKKGALPAIVLQLFKAMDSSKGASHDRYSTQALTTVLRNRGGFAATFADFADANRRPSRAYSDGKLYPTAAPHSSVKLAAGKRSRDRVSLDHLTSKTARFTPGRGLGRQARLRIRVDLPQRSKGSVAVLTTYPTSGKVVRRLIRLDPKGDGSLSVPFATRDVKYAELTLVNASTSYRSCYQANTSFACSGRPVDQGLAASYVATAVR
ncbi:unannotated protein [freshwater metagenome]|uniref:Unannotated protein n=1 Tax=freshwater metagenome TaxID=449393 RepID=A0A6J6QSH3_9ZZZZ